jgi:hypothetical protein
MPISDDRLIAYADGELDAPELAAERSAIEAAARADPILARRIEQHRALRARLGALYGELLDGPVPERLVAEARAAPLAADPAPVADVGPLRAGWFWAAVAASLALGVAISAVAFTARGSGPVAVQHGRLLARSALDQALTLQLTPDRAPSGAARIALTFKSRAGTYCRSFVLADREPLAGVACREGDAWHIEVLARTDTAAPDLPEAVRATVAAQIKGDALDAQGEARARQNHWH